MGAVLVEELGGKALQSGMMTVRGSHGDVGDGAADDDDGDVVAAAAAADDAADDDDDDEDEEDDDDDDDDGDGDDGDDESDDNDDDDDVDVMMILMVIVMVSVVMMILMLMMMMMMMMVTMMVVMMMMMMMIEMCTTWRDNFGNFVSKPCAQVVGLYDGHSHGWQPRTLIWNTTFKMNPGLSMQTNPSCLTGLCPLHNDFCSVTILAQTILAQVLLAPRSHQVCLDRVSVCFDGWIRLDPLHEKTTRRDLVMNLVWILLSLHC